MARVKRYSQTVVAGLLAVGLLAGLYLLSQSAGWRHDATSNKRHSLSLETRQVLDQLAEPVKAVVFSRPGDPQRVRVEDLLELYARRNDLFTYEIADPDKDPLRAKELGVTQIGEAVVLSGEKQEKIALPDEQKLTNAVIRVTDPGKSTIYFVQGHGEFTPDAREHGSLSVLRNALEAQGALAQKLFLVREKSVPGDADALIIAGPQKDFLDSELTALTRYFQSGGRILYAISAEDAVNLDDWLAEAAGLARDPGLVLDPVSQIVTGNYLTPIVQSYGMHPITKDFSLVTLYPTCTALSVERTAPGGGPRLLGESSENSWLESDLKMLVTGEATFDEPQDVPGPLWLSAVYEAEGNATSGPSRLAVFGDQDFLSDRYVKLSGNLDMAMNTVNWLLAKENLITISKPKP
ncbi:MAG: GldG family protein, partial [Desulfovibrionaceae bacterium]